MGTTHKGLIGALFLGMALFLGAPVGFGGEFTPDQLKRSVEATATTLTNIARPGEEIQLAIRLEIGRPLLMKSHLPEGPDAVEIKLTHPVGVEVVSVAWPAGKNRKVNGTNASVFEARVQPVLTVRLPESLQTGDLLLAGTVYFTLATDVTLGRFS